MIVPAVWLISHMHLRDLGLVLLSYRAHSVSPTVPSHVDGARWGERVRLCDERSSSSASALQAKHRKSNHAQPCRRSAVGRALGCMGPVRRAGHRNKKTVSESSVDGVDGGEVDGRVC